LNVNISTTVGQIFFTKIDNFIENRQIFMLLNCNCAKLGSIEDFKTCLGGRFFRGHSVQWGLIHIYGFQWLLLYPYDSTQVNKKKSILLWISQVSSGICL